MIACFAMINKFLFKNLYKYYFLCNYIYIVLYILLITLNMLIINKTSPYFLIFNAVFLSVNSFLFGPIVLWRMTVFFYILALFDLLYTVSFLMLEDVCIFYNFGKLYIISDIIDIQFLFCCDILSCICSALVIFLGLLTIQFSIEYMHREFNVNYLLYFLTLFISMIILLFYAFDLTLILAIWESIGLLSYVLVNYYKGRIFTIKSSFKTFVYSRVSDFNLFIFYILIVYEFNTTSLANIFSLLPYYMYHEITAYTITIHYLSTISFLLFIAASVKAAQFWWHVWLPDAMDAPTPASALIHSSTLVIMGIYVLLRFSILLEFTFYVNICFAIYGSITIAIGAVTAICQTDLKKLIAYSTISQIGYLFLGCGFCAFNEVLLYLIVHALNKATLFVIAGFIIHFFKGNTDMRFMGNINNITFDLNVNIFLIWMNLSGFPGTFGFFSKEFLLLQCLYADYISFVCFIGFMISFFCTPMYTLLILTKVSFGFKKSENFIFYSYLIYLKTTSLKFYNISILRVDYLKHKPTLAYLLNAAHISGFISTIFLFILIVSIMFIDCVVLYNIYIFTGINKIFFSHNYLTLLTSYNSLQMSNLNNIVLINLNNIVLIIFITLVSTNTFLQKKFIFHKKIRFYVFFIFLGLMVLV